MKTIIFVIASLAILSGSISNSYGMDKEFAIKHGLMPETKIVNAYIQVGPLEQCMANSQAMPRLCKGLPSGKNDLDDIIKNN